MVIRAPARSTSTQRRPAISPRRSGPRLRTARGIPASPQVRELLLADVDDTERKTFELIEELKETVETFAAREDRLVRGHAECPPSVSANQSEIRSRPYAMLSAPTCSTPPSRSVKITFSRRGELTSWS